MFINICTQYICYIYTAEEGRTGHQPDELQTCIESVFPLLVIGESFTEATAGVFGQQQPHAGDTVSLSPVSQHRNGCDEGL